MVDPLREMPEVWQRLAGADNHSITPCMLSPFFFGDSFSKADPKNKIQEVIEKET